MVGTSDEETIRSVPPSGAPRLGAIDCSSTVTQAFPSAIVIACGLPPTAIVAWLVGVGSNLVTVPSPLFATHTDPAPTATPAGESPHGDRRGHRRVSGSIRTTASSSESTTHTPPAPTAIPVGALPTPIGVSSPLGSTRTTLPASGSVSHIAPRRLRSQPGWRSDHAARLLPLVPSRRVSRPGRGRDPDRVALRGDRHRPGPDRRYRSARRCRTCRTRDRRDRPGHCSSPGYSTTHRPRGPAAIPVGGPATGIMGSVRRLFGSTREIVWSPRLATHSDPEPNAIPPGRSPTGTAATTRSLASVDRRHRVGRHPDGARARACQLHRDRGDRRQQQCSGGRDQGSRRAAGLRAPPARAGGCARRGHPAPGSWARIARSSS